MKNRILRHKNNRVYLKLFSDGFKHYVVDKSEASKFELKRAKILINQFKHPENWEIIKEAVSEAKSQR